MKYTAILFIFLLQIIPQTFSQEKKMDAYQSGVDLVKTEYAFADSTKNSTVRDGFLQFIADDGVLFRPGPVDGKTFLENSNSNPGTLLWYPTYSIISSSGDLGVNSGPWEYKKTLNEESIAFGQFVTVWEKQPDGSWKFLIDLGVDHSKNSDAKEKIENATVINNLIIENTESNTTVFQVERNSGKPITNKRYKELINEETIILRNKFLPITAEMLDFYVSEFRDTEAWKTLGGKVSAAKDLAYTYGKGAALTNQKVKGTPRKEFYYLHVWVKEGGNWKLRFDVVSEVEREE